MIYAKKNARSLLNVQFLCMDRSKGRVADLQTIRSAWTPTGTIWTAIPANPLADGTLSDMSLLASPLMAFFTFPLKFLIGLPCYLTGQKRQILCGVPDSNKRRLRRPHQAASRPSSRMTDGASAFSGIGAGTDGCFPNMSFRTDPVYFFFRAGHYIIRCQRGI